MPRSVAATSSGEPDFQRVPAEVDERSISPHPLNLERGVHLVKVGGFDRPVRRFQVDCHILVGVAVEADDVQQLGTSTLTIMRKRGNTHMAFEVKSCNLF